REFLVVLCHADVVQIPGSARSRNDRIEVIGSGEIPTCLFVKAAVSCQSARYLAYTIRSEVKADARIFVAGPGQGFPAMVRANKRYDEFIGHSAVIRLLHALNRVDIFSALSFAVDHGLERLRDPLPAAVAIHGVVATMNGGD